jgi:hypothetical protein
VKRRSTVLEGEGGGLCVMLSLGARAYPDILAAAAAQKGEEGRRRKGMACRCSCKRTVSRNATEFNLQRSHPSGAQVLGLATIRRAPDLLPNECPSLDLLQYFDCTLSNCCHPPNAPWKFRSSESPCQDKHSGPSDFHRRKTFGARSPSPCTLLDLCLRRVLLSSLSVYLYLYIFA